MSYMMSTLRSSTSTCVQGSTRSMRAPSALMAAPRIAPAPMRLLRTSEHVAVSSTSSPVQLQQQAQEEIEEISRSSAQASSSSSSSGQSLMGPSWHSLASMACAVVAMGAASCAIVGAADAAAMPLAQLAEVTPENAKLAESILRPLFSVYTVLYIVRIPLSWYPEINIKSLPWVLVGAPTEPFLNITRKAIGLVGGVDVSPIVWVAAISFFSEIMLGPQGILPMIQRQSGGL